MTGQANPQQAGLTKGFAEAVRALRDHTLNWPAAPARESEDCRAHGWHRWLGERERLLSSVLAHRVADLKGCEKSALALLQEVLHAQQSVQRRLEAGLSQVARELASATRAGLAQDRYLSQGGEGIEARQRTGGDACLDSRG